MKLTILLLPAVLVLANCAATTNGTDQTVVSADTPARPAGKLEVLATGAEISGSNGLHFGPDGLLYVTSVVGSDLSIVDPDSGDIVKRYTAEDGVIGPDDVAFAPDGSFYWTSILTGEVAGFDPEGNKIVAAQLTPGSNPITFSDDGRLFVSQCFLDDGLYELDPSGEAEPRLIADDLGPGCGLNGMDWGPDGRLYGPRWFAGEVVSYDVDLNTRRQEATGFKVPAAIKFDSKGVLHVLDTGTGELLRVENGTNQVVASLTPGLDNFAFDENDVPFVSSYTDGFIKRVNSDGSVTEILPGGLSHPGGIAVVGDIVWVADGQTLRGVDRHSGDEVVTERNIIGVSDIGGLMNLSVDGTALILSSWFDGDVRIWDPAQKKRTAQFPDLAAPVSAVRYAGGLAIAEHAKGSVTLYGVGEPSVLAADLPAPTALVVDGKDLLVSDHKLGEIKRIATNGAALSNPETVVTDLVSPEGFLLTNGGLVVVEAEPGVVTFVDAEGNRRKVADIPSGSPAFPGFPPSQIFNGIAMDEDSNLYVTGEMSRALYRINAPW